MFDFLAGVPSCTNAQIEAAVKGGNDGENVCCSSTTTSRATGQTVVEAHKAVRTQRARGSQGVGQRDTQGVRQRDSQVVVRNERGRQRCDPDHPQMRARVGSDGTHNFLTRHLFFAFAGSLDGGGWRCV